MQSASTPVFFCCLFLQRLPGIACGDLGTTDYIAISVSLALTVLTLSFIGYFLWRAQHGSTMHVDQEMGQDNPAVAVYRNEKVKGVSMSPLPATTQEQNDVPEYVELHI